MMNFTTFKTVLISVLSATAGYLMYLRTDAATGLITTFMAAWILFQFRGFEDAWGSLGNFQNPILFGINVSFATFVYTSWKGFPMNKTFYLMVAGFLLGGVASTMIYKYWNIGG